MPSQSKSQQRFFGVVKAMQKGDMPKKGEAGKAAKTMDKDDVDDFASTKHKGLPEKKKVTESEILEMIQSIVREEMIEGFAGALKKEDRKKFDDARRKQAEVLGYKLTGTSDIKVEIDDATIKESKLKEAYLSKSLFFDKKYKSKLQKLLKKHKGKFPFNPFGEPVVNWSLDDRGSKGIEWSGIPKYNYDKAVEFFMKNKLNPRG